VPGVVAGTFLAKASKSFLLAAVSEAFEVVSAKLAAGPHSCRGLFPSGRW